MDRNERIIRKAYETAEAQDIDGFVALFAVDAIIRDESNGAEYRGGNLGGIVTDAARAFPDMHRELYDFYVSGDVVVVELSLNGTNRGPLNVPGGRVEATAFYNSACSRTSKRCSHIDRCRADEALPRRKECT